jgi:hypothetical protein
MELNFLATDGPLQEKLMTWTRLTVPGFLACFVALNAMTLLAFAHIVAAFRHLILGPLFLIGLLLTFNILRDIRKKRPGRARGSFPFIRRRRLSNPGLLDPEPCL